MQLYTLASMLVCASALAQAAPLLNSTGVCNASLATITDVAKPVDYNFSTDGNKLVARQGVITPDSRLTQNSILSLASGALLTVTSITYGGNVPVPQIDGNIATTLNGLGTFLGTNYLPNPGNTARDVIANPPMGTLWVTWETVAAQVPNLTSLEWQTILTAMYRAWMAQTSLGDYITAIFDIGGTVLNVDLSWHHNGGR